MAFRWKWHEYAVLLVLSVVWVLTLIMVTTLISERMVKGTILTAGLLAGLTLTILAFIMAKRKGALEHATVQRVEQGFLAATALFTVMLFVPTEKNTGSADFGGVQVQDQRPRYDARQQPGADLYVQMRDAVKNDELTLSIFDICVGKVSHRVFRDGKPAAEKIKVTDPGVLTAHIKSEARALGAKTVGIAPLTEEFVFTHDQDGHPLHLPHTSAIVVGMNLNYLLAGPSSPLPWQDLYSSIPEELAAVLSGKMVKTATNIDAETIDQTREALRFFSEGGKTAVELARYIRAMGYSARVHYQRWSEVQIVPLAIRAGLGELARNGMVISGELGPRGSFAVVTTDLPLVHDHAVAAGIRPFCQICTKCAAYCPVQAIPFGEPKMVRGVVKWNLDGEKCGDYLVSNPKCMACLASCPFNKPDYFLHRAAVFMVGRRSRLADTLLLAMDNLLGYGEMAAKIGNPAAADLVKDSAGNAVNLTKGSKGSEQ